MTPLAPEPRHSVEALSFYMCVALYRRATFDFIDPLISCSSSLPAALLTREAEEDWGR